MAKHADDRAIRIQNQYAGLLAARLATASSVELPAAPFVHLFVARGAVELEGAGTLGTGDAARITGQPTASGSPRRRPGRDPRLGDARDPGLIQARRRTGSSGSEEPFALS